MQALFRKILLFIVIGVLMILVALIPEATGGLLNEWGLKYLGDSYQLYLICIFVVAVLLLTYLTPDSWRGNGDALQAKRSTSYNIPKTAANQSLCNRPKGLLVKHNWLMPYSFYRNQYTLSIGIY
jgi:hypothetical protein